MKKNLFWNIGIECVNKNLIKALIHRGSSNIYFQTMSTLAIYQGLKMDLKIYIELISNLEAIIFDNIQQFIHVSLWYKQTHMHLAFFNSLRWTNFSHTSYSLPVSRSLLSMTIFTMFRSTPVSKTARTIGCCRSARWTPVSTWWSEIHVYRMWTDHYSLVSSYIP